MEDLSCKAVNDAYVATFSTPRVTVKTYYSRADGSMKLHDEARYSELDLYEKLAVSNQWLRRYRSSIDTVDSRGPIFTSCKLMQATATESSNLLHDSATWNSFPNPAAYEVWISAYSTRAMKTVRDYSRTNFPFRTVVEVFDYDPQDALPPNGLSLPKS